MSAKVSPSDIFAVRPETSQADAEAAAWWLNSWAPDARPFAQTQFMGHGPELRERDAAICAWQNAQREIEAELFTAQQVEAA